MADAVVTSLPALLLVAGVVIAILEAIAPGAHFIVLGVALFVAGLVGLLLPPLAGPLALAAVVLLTGVGALFAYRRFGFYRGDSAGRTKDSSSLTGKGGEVLERVTETSGRVRLYDGGFDPVYSARTVEGVIEEGTDVVVVDPGGGSVLTVADASGIEADSIDRELAKERRRRERGRDREREGERDADPE